MFTIFRLSMNACRECLREPVYYLMLLAEHEHREVREEPDHDERRHQHQVIHRFTQAFPAGVHGKAENREHRGLLRVALALVLQIVQHFSQCLGTGVRRRREKHASIGNEKAVHLPVF